MDCILAPTAFLVKDPCPFGLPEILMVALCPRCEVWYAEGPDTSLCIGNQAPKPTRVLNHVLQGL